MPFTLSHPAAALILRRMLPRLPFAALVIGTIAPDVEYLLRLAPRGSFGHSAAGLLLFCLPVSLALWCAHRRWVRPALIDLLPPGLASGLAQQRTVGSVAVVAAVLVGALSHVAWDAFTHDGGLAVRQLPALRAPVAGGLPGYKLLQHGSTLVGGLLLLWTVRAWVWAQPPAARRFAPGQAVRSARVVALLLGVVVLAAVLNGSRGLGRGPVVGLGFAAVGALAGLGLALLGYGFYARRTAA